jgi:hypothetical protein
MNTISIDIYNLSSFVGCIPYSHQKNPPKDQKGAKLELCYCCNKKMWVSDKKRELKEKKFTLICWICLLKNLTLNGIDPKDIKLLDILMLN